MKKLKAFLTSPKGKRSCLAALGILMLPILVRAATPKSINIYVKGGKVIKK